MAIANPSRLGQVNATGDALILFEKVMTGEVLTAFQTKVIMADKHMTRNITHGKSAAFPMTWKIGSETHVPGTEIQGLPVKHNEKVISIDDLLISHAFLANIDEAMNHYEVRGEYSTQMGHELAKQYDKNVARNVLLAARGTHPIDTAYNGTSVTNAGLDTSGVDIAASIFEAMENLDNLDVPDEDRYAILPVAQYYLAVQNTNILNKDWGGAGSYSRAEAPLIANCPVYMSKHFPSGNETADPNVIDKYEGDWTNTRGVVYQKGAAGTVKLMDLAFEQEYDIRRQGHLMVARYAVGHGPLRTECACELKTA